MSESDSAAAGALPDRPRRIRLPFFYGWLLVAIAFVTMAIGVNARTAFSLLFPAILDEFGWDVASPLGLSRSVLSSRR